MMEQQFAITYRNHVVMEHTLVNDRRILLRKHHTRLAQTVKAGDRLRRFEGLARRVLLRRRVTAVERAAPENKNSTPASP